MLTYKKILDAPPGEVEGVQVGVGEGVLEAVGEGEGEDEGGAPIPFGSETTLIWVPHSAAPAPYKKLVFAPLLHCQPHVRDVLQVEGAVLYSPTHAIPGTACSHAASPAVRMLARALPCAEAAHAATPAAHVPVAESAR